MLRLLSVLRREKGASAIEFALVAPLLFMLLFGMIAFGLAFLEIQTYRGAVREGARAAAIFSANEEYADSVEIVAATQAALPGYEFESGALEVTPCEGPGGQGIVTYNLSQINGGEGVQVIIPFVPNISLKPKVTAQFMCEG